MALEAIEQRLIWGVNSHLISFSCQKTCDSQAYLQLMVVFHAVLLSFQSCTQVKCLCFGVFSPNEAFTETNFLLCCTLFTL